MASRVYGYYLPPTLNQPGDSRKRGATADLNAAGGDGAASSAASSTTLASVSEQARPAGISITAILTDFRNTMNALGADEPVREEVDAYLKAVSLQAAKDAPSAPFIRQTLKTAADSLDGWIGKTLQQPSRVVRDWVEALLLQPIDYRASAQTAASPAAELKGARIGAASASAAMMGAAAPITAGRASGAASARAIALNAEEKARFRAAFDAGKTLAAQGQTQPALTALNEALTLAQEKGQTGLQGKALYAMGKVAHLSGDPARQNEALDYYERAQQKFAESQQVAQQGRALAAMGAIHDDRNELAQAASYYAGALAQSREAGDSRLTGRILNDAGMVNLRQGQIVEAIARFQDAANANTSSQQGDRNLLPDIYNNLGEAYRLQDAPEQAATAFRQSLKWSQELRDKDGYLDALEKLAALYENVGSADKASVYRQRLQRLQAG